jgi:hypothetical protein
MLLEIKYTFVLFHTPYLQREGKRGGGGFIMEGSTVVVVKAHHKGSSC